jgi:tight adherence protein B
MNNKSKTIVTVSTTPVLVFIFTNSISIALACGTLLTLMSYIATSKSEIKRHKEISENLPELIDAIITGIQSGMSLAESLSSLSIRGPRIFSVPFANFQENVNTGISFEMALTQLELELNHVNCDQLLESILYSRELGGSDLIQILRQLSEFVRNDLMLRKELIAKQTWIVNSAHISSVAPWLLLVMLGTQSSTAQSYATPTGYVVLFLGILATLIAYLWMSKLAALPSPPRIFGGKIVS